MKNYILKIIVLCLVLAIAGALLFLLVIPQFYLPVFPWVLLFFAVSSVAIHAWQTKMAKSDMGKFARGNMILTFLKLVLYSVFAVIYIATDTENAKVFVAAFLFIYLVFSVFEVIMLAGITRQRK